MAKQIKVTLIRSTIGQKPKKKATVRSLGLKKIDSFVVHTATPAICGMIRSVAHLIKVEDLNNG